MILIAHIGNTNGPNPEKENTIDYINQALRRGYHCEIDICDFNGTQFSLGHDSAQQSVSIKYLQESNLWCHAKNFKVLEAMCALSIHCFYHKSDEYTMTNRGWIWAYPGQLGGKYTIAVHPEKLHPGDIKKFAGVCSDYVEKFND